MWFTKAHKNFLSHIEGYLFIAHLQDMETREADWSEDETICSAPLPYWDPHGPGHQPLHEAFMWAWQDPERTGSGQKGDVQV